MGHSACSLGCTFWCLTYPCLQPDCHQLEASFLFLKGRSACCVISSWVHRFLNFYFLPHDRSYLQFLVWRMFFRNSFYEVTRCGGVWQKLTTRMNVIVNKFGNTFPYSTILVISDNDLDFRRRSLGTCLIRFIKRSLIWFNKETSLEPHQENVIVNGFGDANDWAYDVSILQLLVNGIGCCITPIAPHHVQVGQSPQVYSSHNLLQISATPGSTLQACTQMCECVTSCIIVVHFLVLSMLTWSHIQHARFTYLINSLQKCCWIQPCCCFCKLSLG